MDYSQKWKLNISHWKDCVSISLVPTKSDQRSIGCHKIPELRCVTIIDPATGWFKIKQYDDKISITVANIVEQEWLARYPRPYLITQGEQHCIISSIVSAIHANDVQDYTGASSASPPVSDTVCTTIDAVAQTYRAHNCPSPIHDDEGKLTFLLQSQLKGYKNNDASCKRQKAFMPNILHFLHWNTWTGID